jgi:tetratricopeptide (TPR) repeat protein
MVSNFPSLHPIRSRLSPLRSRLSPVRGALSALAAFVLLMMTSCAVLLQPAGYEEFMNSVKKGTAIQIYDQLEALVANGDDTKADRKVAYRAIRDKNENTAEFQFAWAGIAGRYVQYKGLLAANLLKDIEKHARKSLELDPNFRNGAAKRILGAMYVAAPSNLVEHGDSEVGLEMLEELVKQYPDDPENHFFLGEAYITLNDPAHAVPHLCYCLSVKSKMRKDEQLALANLFSDAGVTECPGPTPVPAPKKKHKLLDVL